ncbi:MAG: hypothetical protein ABID87_09245, partial [Chloroflexota bacterium]
NGGNTWVTQASLPISPDLVAIAPDDTDLVAIASTSTPAVYISTNGGSTWSTLGTVQETGGSAAATLTDLAISAAASGINYVAVSGTEASEGNVWYFNIGAAAPSWTETNDRGGWGNGAGTGTINATVTTAMAVTFSPNFPSDLTMVGLTHDDTEDIVELQLFSLASSSKLWNVDAGFTGYPVTIVSETGVTAGSLALSPTYLASDDTERTVFIGLEVDTATNDGVWRAKDTNVKGLKTGSGSAVASVAYDGTTLVAGAYASNQVYYSDDPLATTPTVSTARSLKRPGIDATAVDEMTRVAFSGTNVVAITDGAEGAFARSTDNGRTFNDISLISTSVVAATDAAVAEDGVVYFTTDNGTNTSLWRKANDSWTRVLALTSDVNYIVRVAPGDSSAVYVGKKGGSRVYYSADGGLEKWFIRTAGVTIEDLAVESADVVYAMSNASAATVVKSTNSGFTWGSSKSTKLGAGNVLVSVSEDVLLAGSDDGFVAYSMDGGANFTKISKIIASGHTNVSVAADADFANNNTVYAASQATGKNVRKWVIGDSDSWTDIFYSNPTGTAASEITGGVYGLVVMNGALYALEVNTTSNQSTLWQCLTPLTAGSSTDAWNDRGTTATTDDDDTQVRLGISAQSNQGLVAAGGLLYAVKTNGTPKLYSFNDTLNTGGPSIIGPVDAYSNAVNNVTGKANEIAFSWSRLSRATEYKLYIAYDSAFKEIVTTVKVTDDKSTVVQAVGPDRTTPTGSGVNWQLGETYYWRVKVNEPLYSAYSETRTFTIEPGTALVPNILSPINGTNTSKQKPSFSWSPVSGTTKYRFVLANNPQLTAPIVDISTTSTAYAITTNLAEGETYYWAVRSIDPVEGGWSAIANFSVATAPAAPTPPVVVQQVPAPVINIPAPPPAQQIVIPPSPPPPAQIAPAYIWAVIIIGAILVIAVIILIVRTRRTV